MKTVIFDNEAVQALLDPQHRKHRTVLAHLKADLGRRKKRRQGATLLVPTAVRAEAGWDRSATSAAGINLLGIADASLNSTAADAVAQIVLKTGVSVADAHVGATARSVLGDVVVLMSDPNDIVRASSPKSVMAIHI